MRTTASVRSADGTRIVFDVTGHGSPLVLVGAAMQYRALESSQSELAEALAPRFTVYVYDRRGRGESGDTPPYAVERELEDLEAVIGAAGGTAHVMGGSSGAVLSLRAAAHGLMIGRLALYEPPFIVDDSRPPVPSDEYVGRLDELIAAGRRRQAVEYFLTFAVRVPAEMLGEMRRTAIWPAMESVAHTLAYDGRIMGETMSGRTSALEEFASVQTPTLVMSGGLSAPYMRHGARTLAAILPNGEHRTLEGQSHAVQTGAIAPVLEEFFGSQATTFAISCSRSESEANR